MKIKKRVFFGMMTLICGMAAVASDEPAVQTHRQESIKFVPNLELLKTGDSQYFFELYGTDLKPVKEDTFKITEGAFAFLKPLDFEKSWESKDPKDKLYVLITKFSYIIGRDISFFDPERITNTQYLNTFFPKVDYKHIAGSTYRMNGSALIPSASATLKAYRKPEIEKFTRPELLYAKNLDASLGVPDVLMTEHSSHYSKVFFSKTSLSSRSVTAYYSLGPNSTLIVNYTLAYLYSIPPGFLGGPMAIHDMGVSKGFQIMKILRETYPDDDHLVTSK
jgi:hypothetical protein